MTNSLTQLIPMNQEKTLCSKRATTSTPNNTISQPSPSQKAAEAFEASCLSVAPQGQGVVLLPGLPAAGLGLGVAVALVETTGLLASGGEAARLAVLVDGVDDPVDAGVNADGLVLGVDEDDLVVLVGGVLVDPVGVQDAQVGATAADTLLSGRLERALVLELVDTLVGGLTCEEEKRGMISFLQSSGRVGSVGSRLENRRPKRTIGSTLGGRSLATTTADTHTVDNIALLGLVTETASLVGARGARGAVDDVQLTELY